MLRPIISPHVVICPQLIISPIANWQLVDKINCGRFDHCVMCICTKYNENSKHHNKYSHELPSRVFKRDAQSDYHLMTTWRSDANDNNADVITALCPFPSVSVSAPVFTHHSSSRLPLNLNSFIALQSNTTQQQCAYVVLDVDRLISVAQGPYCILLGYSRWPFHKPSTTDNIVTTQPVTTPHCSICRHTRKPVHKSP